MINTTNEIPCLVCHGPLSLRLARGRKSGKPSIMLICPTDGRHFRGFISDRAYVGQVLALLVICSGAVSLVYEVFWTRLLSHLLGGSLYAFSTMMTSFLAGIALGSALASRFAATAERSVAGFALAQLGIAACTAASYAAVVRYSSVSAFVGSPDRHLASDALLAASALLPAAICIGATFPFAVRLLARRARDAAPASARVYSWS